MFLGTYNSDYTRDVLLHLQLCLAQNLQTEKERLRAWSLPRIWHMLPDHPGRQSQTATLLRTRHFPLFRHKSTAHSATTAAKCEANQTCSCEFTLVKKKVKAISID